MPTTPDNRQDRQDPQATPPQGSEPRSMQERQESRRSRGPSNMGSQQNVGAPNSQYSGNQKFREDNPDFKAGESQDPPVSYNDAGEPITFNKYNLKNWGKIVEKLTSQGVPMEQINQINPEVLQMVDKELSKMESKGGLVGPPGFNGGGPGGPGGPGGDPSGDMGRPPMGGRGNGRGNRHSYGGNL